MIRILLISLVALLSSCRSIQYVPVETVRTDSVFFNKLVRDSLVIRDSVFIRDRGDTIYQYKYKYIYKDRILRDTAYIERTDTIRIPYPVEREPSFWDKTKNGLKVFFISIISIVILGIVYKRVK